MVDEQLLLRCDRLIRAHRRVSDEFAAVLEQIALARIRDVLPTADVLEVYGDLNEEFSPRLRIRRVLDDTSEVLFDVRDGHEDRRVEDVVDEIDIEYLERLVEVTYGDHMGPSKLRG